jgi:uncharacterized membrane protein
METGRVEAFSDGVFAIAITLLVLGIGIPSTQRAHGRLGSALAQEWPAYVAYLVSFLVIGIIWVNHHAMFHLIARVDRPLLFINLALLATVAIIPFPTGLIAEYIRHGVEDADLAVAVYSLAMLVMGLVFGSLWLWATRPGGHLLRDRLDPGVARGTLKRFAAGTAVYAVLVGLSFVSATLTLVIHLLVAFYYVVDQLAVGDASPSDTQGTADPP